MSNAPTRKEFERACDEHEQNVRQGYGYYPSRKKLRALFSQAITEGNLLAQKIEARAETAEAETRRLASEIQRLVDGLWTIESSDMDAESLRRLARALLTVAAPSPYPDPLMEVGYTGEGARAASQ